MTRTENGLLDNFSEDNLKLLESATKIILNQYQLNHNRLTRTTIIPIKSIERESISKGEFLQVIKVIRKLTGDDSISAEDSLSHFVDIQEHGVRFPTNVTAFDDGLEIYERYLATQGMGGDFVIAYLSGDSSVSLIENLRNKLSEKLHPLGISSKLPIKQKIKLKNTTVEYNDDEAVFYIKIIKEVIKCQLPPYKNEHYFCRAMYEHKVNEPVDWSEIYEKINGYYEAYYGKPPATRANWRVVYDAMDAMNKRVKETVKTDDELFTWQEKTVKRNY